MKSSLRAAVDNVLNKNLLLYDGQAIRKSDYISETSDIVLKIISGKSPNRGMIVHPGANISFYISVILLSFAAFLFDDDDESFLSNLSIGDMVIYKDKRGQYLGIDSEGKIIIKTIVKTELIEHVPPILTHRIKPYYGKAKTLDGRGIKRGSAARNKFLANLFDKQYKEIKSLTNRSIVVVCSKKDVNDIMNNFRINASRDSVFSIGELFPAAFYTQNEVIHFAGNSAKLEPVIKFTTKMSVARELILEDSEKNIMGLLVNGVTDSSELTSIISRRSLRNVILLGNLSSDDHIILKKQFEILDLYVWTKGAIQAKVKDILNSIHEECSEIDKLYKMLNNCIYKEINVADIDSPTDKKNFVNCRRALFRIAKNAEKGSDKELFVIRGFSLFNLFEKSCFPIAVMEKIVQNGTIKAISPAEQLQNLEKIASKFKGELGNDMATVISSLVTMRKALLYDNPKYQYLTKVLIRNKNLKANLVIIVPKEYYHHVFKEALPKELKCIMKYCEFVTPSKFDISVLYGEIIACGIFDYRKFNPLVLSNVNFVDLMCYSSEEPLYSSLERANKRQSEFLEENNSIEYDKTTSQISITSKTEDDIDDMIKVNSELECYIDNFLMNNAISIINSMGIEAHQSVAITKFATFDTGECIFFTKNYSPYVLDESKQIVMEAEVSNLRTGDILIFTSYDETRDIVEKIIEELIKSGKCNKRFKEAYRKSMHWKNVLRNYIQIHCLTYKELSQKMYNIGKAKHEVTLRTWLDADSHIVGPRDADSFYAVALLTNDNEMIENPDLFCEACNEVRSMRIRILKYIGLNIIQAYTNNSGFDELLTSFDGDISKMSKIVQIEKIVNTNELSVPTHMANRLHFIDK